MLAGIPGAEFALARDFLVMHDDQINVMNSLRNPEINDEQTVVATRAISEEIENDLEATIPVTKNNSVNDEVTPTKEPEKKSVRRSKRQINDKKTFWDEDCHKSGDCTSKNVRTIADQAVPSRAIATLPGSYLSINKLPASSVTPGGSHFGVFAKRNIRSRTQFGPIEGVLCPCYDTTFENALPLLLESETGEFLKIDVSNESMSITVIDLRMYTKKTV